MEINHCPHCKGKYKFIKAGTYRRKNGKIVQRFQCQACKKGFSEQTFNYNYRFKKPHLDLIIFRLLCTSTSQRKTALVVGVNPKTIDLRVKRFGIVCIENLEQMRELETSEKIGFDEMESFEHSKCKPITLPIAVDMKSRKILAISSGNIAAKGHLAEISKKKYGIRKCERNKALEKMFLQLKKLGSKNFILLTDESPHYPKKVKKYFPDYDYVRFKGRRACVVGQGELKEGGRDPLFNLNHTYAMIRDNVKRLTRKTWCTTKKLLNLNYMLHIYAFFHNQLMYGLRPKIFNF